MLSLLAGVVDECSREVPKWLILRRWAMWTRCEWSEYFFQLGWEGGVSAGIPRYSVCARAVADPGEGQL
jgi:hypothetical protein